MKHLRLFKDREEFNAADLEYPTLSLIQEDNSTVIDETAPTIIAKYVFEEDIPEGTACFYSETTPGGMCDFGINAIRSFTSFEVNGEELVTPPSPAVSLGTYYPTALSSDPLSFSEDSFFPAETTYAEIKFSKPAVNLGIYLEGEYTGENSTVVPISAIQQQLPQLITIYSDDFIRFNCARFLEWSGLDQVRMVLFSADGETPESIEEVNSYSPIVQAFSGGESILNPGNNRSWPAGEYTVKMEFDRKQQAQFNYFFQNCTGLREIYCNGNFIKGIFSEGFCVSAENLEAIVISSNNFIDGLEESFCENCYGLTTIILPESVKSIGEYAFYDCSSLASINIPKSVTSIGNDAFYDCSSLISINIPESVTRIGERAFEDCRFLTSINIPDSVTSIGERAFSGCSSLTSITVAENNAIYDSRETCNAIIETSSNTLIYGGSTTIIPETVTKIGEEAFYKCSSLTSITIPERVTSIGDSAFDGCSSLISINILGGVTSIGGRAFSDCSSITSINIPEGVTSIRDYVFSGCSSLASINLPEGMTSIGSYAFSGCSGITSITCNAVTPPSITSTNTFTNVNKSIPVYVPASSIDAYKAAKVWKSFTNFQAI